MAVENHDYDDDAGGNFDECDDDNYPLVRVHLQHLLQQVDGWQKSSL